MGYVDPRGTGRFSCPVLDLARYLLCALTGGLITAGACDGGTQPIAATRRGRTHIPEAAGTGIPRPRLRRLEALARSRRTSRPVHTSQPHRLRPLLQRAPSPRNSLSSNPATRLQGSPRRPRAITRCEPQRTWSPIRRPMVRMSTWPLNSRRTLPSPLNHISSWASRSNLPAVSMLQAWILL